MLKNTISRLCGVGIKAVEPFSCFSLQNCITTRIRKSPAELVVEVVGSVLCSCRIQRGLSTGNLLIFFPSLKGSQDSFRELRNVQREAFSNHIGLVFSSFFWGGGIRAGFFYHFVSRLSLRSLSLPVTTLRLFSACNCFHRKSTRCN